MMDVYNLPTSLCIGGVDCCIRTDFRAIIDILRAFNDPDVINAKMGVWVMIKILFEHPEQIPPDCIEEAIKKALEFIDGGFTVEEKTHPPKVMDWDKDAKLIMAAVNKVAGEDIRAQKYVHWWTFLSHYAEVGESTLTYIIGIRQKKAKHEKLE